MSKGRSNLVDHSSMDGIESLQEMESLPGFQHTDQSLFGMSGSVYDRLRLKMAFMIFVVFCVINSDAFAEQVLAVMSPRNYNASMDKLTEMGILSGGAILACTYILLDLLETSGVL